MKLSFEHHTKRKKLARNIGIFANNIIGHSFLKNKKWYNQIVSIKRKRYLHILLLLFIYSSIINLFKNQSQRPLGQEAGSECMMSRLSDHTNS